MKKTNNTQTVKNGFILIFLISFFSLCTYAQIGTNDSTFNTPDAGENSILKGPDSRITLSDIQLSNNKIIIAGDFTNYNGSSANHIARLNINGNIDNTFNMGSGFNNAPSSLVIQSDNKILVGGSFSVYNGLPVQFFIRLNANGNIDNTFKMGTGFNGPIASIAVQADGKILVGGIFSNYNGTSNNGLVRLNKNGTIDASFNATDTSYTNISKIALDTYGKIIIAYRNFALRKLNSNGSKDNSFTNHVYFPFDSERINALKIQQDGKIIIGGGSENTGINGVTGILHRYNKNGEEDTTFAGGYLHRYIIHSLNIQNDGKIIVTGSQNIVPDDHIACNYISRLLPDGSIDSTFLQVNKTTQRVNATYTSTIQPDGKIIVGGFFKEVNTCTANNLVRLNTDGSLDHTFNKTTGANGTIRTSAIQKNGKIIIGGNFYAYQYKSRNHIARLTKNGTIDNSFDPGTGTNGPVYSIASRTDNKIVIGGDFTSFNGSNRNKLAQLNIDGSLDESFNLGNGPNGIVRALAIQADKKIIVGGEFTKFNDQTFEGIVRLNENGSIDNSFAPPLLNNFYGLSINSIIILPSGKILIGGLFGHTFNGIVYYNLMRLNSDGSIDDSFNPEGYTNPVHALSVQLDGKIIVAGGKQYVQHRYHSVILRYHSEGKIDTTFKSTTSLGKPFEQPYLQSICLLDNNKILVGGQFTKFGDVVTNHIVLLNTDGTVDSTFVGDANGDVWTTHVLKEEKVLVGGGFNVYNGMARNAITRILCSSPTYYSRKELSQEANTNNSEMQETNFSIYPNPTSETLIIDQLEVGGNLTITDLSGRVLHSSNIVNSRVEVNVAKYSSGVYFVKYISNGEVSMKKFCVN